MSFNPNPRFSSALAIAMMPTENFANKRADAVAAMQFEQVNAQQAAANVEIKKKALTNVQNTLSAIDQASLLDMDKRRLTAAVADPLRQQAEDILRTEYGGDIERFERERGDLLTTQFAKQLLASPLYSKATSNMTNFTFAQEAKKKGHVLQGDFDKNLQEFATGKTDTLNFQGDYEPPKNVFEYFDQNNHPEYKYGRYVGQQPRNKAEQYKAIEVTQADLIDRLIGTGLTPQQATDYVAKINYQGGRTWKMDKQSPWDYQQQQNTERHQRVSEQQGWAHINLARQRERRERAKDEAEAKGATAFIPTILTEVYDGVDSKPAFLNNQSLTVNDKPVRVKEGVPGHTGDVLKKVAGIGEYVGDRWNEKTRRYDNGYISSSIRSARTLDHGRVVQNKDNSLLQFKEVDPSRIFYYPDENGRGGYTPHIMATAKVDGHAVQVMVPIPYNELTKGELVNQAAMYNSKEDRAQAAMPPLSRVTAGNRGNEGSYEYFNLRR